MTGAGEFYRMDFRAWDTGTVDLSLEQEGAYLRLCHAMYNSRGPIPESTRLLQGLFRCGNVKATALVKQLVEEGKIYRTEDGKLMNQRVALELEHRERVSEARKSAGARGGGAERRKVDRSSSDDAVKVECPPSDTPVDVECLPSDFRLKFAKPLINQGSIEAIAPTLESRGDKIREESPKAPKGAEPEGFAEFWKTYPRRFGENPRKAALRAYKAAIARGANHATVMASLRVSISELEAKGKINTEFVPRASTWLNEDRFDRSDESGTAPKSQTDPAAYLAGISDETWRNQVNRFQQSGEWLLKHRTPPPDDPQTKVPPIVLASFGIVHRPSQPALKLVG